MSSGEDESEACAERSEAKGSVSKGDQEGEKVDAVAGGLGTNGRRCQRGFGELEMLRSWTQHAGLCVARELRVQ